LDNINKILVIIPYRGIGDAIFHLPLLRSLFLKFKKKIYIINNPVNHLKEIITKENFLKKIYHFNVTRGNILNFFSKSIYLFKLIKKINPDLIVCTDPSKRFIIPILFNKAKKNYIIGRNKYFFLKKNFRQRYLAEHLKSFIKKKLLIDKFGYNIELPKQNLLSFKNKAKPWIFINVDSAHNHNNWPLQNYFLLIEKVETKGTIFLNFSPKNFLIKKMIFKKDFKKKNVVLLYKENISNLINIINNSDIIIGNESGPICIAASLKKKTISLISNKFLRFESKALSNSIKYFIFNNYNSQKILKKIIHNINASF